MSRLIGLGLLIVLFNLRTTIEVHLRSLSPFPWGQLKKLLAIGIPSGGESVSYNLSQMVITKIVNGFGTAVINTRVYANMFAMVSYMYGSAVSQAAQILVGVLIGGRKLEDAHKQVMRTIIYSLIIGVGVSTLLYIFSDSLFGLFTDDPAVLRLGKQVMLIEIFLEAGRAVNMTQVRALQAAGDIQFPILLGHRFAMGRRGHALVCLCGRHESGRGRRLAGHDDRRSAACDLVSSAVVLGQMENPESD